MNFRPFFLRETHKSTNAIRWFAGISITNTCQRIESAILGIHGRGSGAPVEIRKTISFDIPREITDSFNELQETLRNQNKRCLCGDSEEMNVPATLSLHVARELACIEEEAIHELLGESRLSPDEVLAVGVNDPGLHVQTVHGMFYQGLCDAPYLAEQTGMNIVDSFPAQDIAARGNGTPLFPLPAWIFLKSETQPRVLLDLGRTARLTFLPRANNHFSHQKIQHGDIVPCGSLLDTSIWQLSAGKIAADLGGRIAVQGCQNPQLMSAFRNALSHKENTFHSVLTPNRYVQMVNQATQDGVPHQDVLCTVSCFIAETVAGRIKELLAANVQGEIELLIHGAGQQHGLLMNSLVSHLHNKAFLPISQLGIPDDTFDGLCTAVLTSLAVDHLPSNLPHLTGSEVSKTLGRITQGSVTNWQRLLCEMTRIQRAA